MTSSGGGVVGDVNRNRERTFSNEARETELEATTRMDHGVEDGSKEAVEHPWVPFHPGCADVRLGGEDKLFDDLGHVFLEKSTAEILEVRVVEADKAQILENIQTPDPGL